MILELMRKRRSVRRFQDVPLPEVTLRKLIDAAVTAPSAGNKQPWRFLVVRDRAMISAALKEVESARRALIDEMADEFREGFSEYSKNFLKFGSAPAIIVPLYREIKFLSHMLKAQTNCLPDLFEHNSALMSVSLAVQNILLMAEELEIGACCFTGPLIADAGLRKIFGVQPEWNIAAVIAAGFPAEKPADIERKGADIVTKWI